MFGLKKIFPLLLLLLPAAWLKGQEYSFALGEKYLQEGKLAACESLFIAAKDSYLLVKNDTAVALCYNHLAEAKLHQGQYNSGLAYNEAGLLYARRAPYSTAYLRLLLFTSEYHNMIGNFDVGKSSWREINGKIKVVNDVSASAFKTFATSYLLETSDTFEIIAKQGLNIALQFKDSVQIANAYRILADRAQLFADIPNAISYALKGLKYSPTTKPIIKANYFMLLANCFRSLDDFNKALDYSKRAEVILESSHYHSLKHNNNRTIADLHAAKDNIDLAESYWNKSLDYYLSKNKLKSILSIYNNQLSHYTSLKSWETADQLFKRIQEIDLSKADFESQNYTYSSLTNYFIAKKEYSKAKKEILQWEKVKDKIANPENQYEYLHQSSRLSEAEGLIDTSINLLIASNTMMDSIKRKKQSDVVYLLEAAYLKNQKKVEIAILDKENEMKQLKVAQLNTLVIFSSIILFLALIMTFVFYRRNQIIEEQKNEIRKNLDEKNILLEEIHSRVKNSLQTISSILSLQSRSMEDGIAAETIKEGQNRVNSMAIIHENLFLENNTSQINIKTYIDQLLDALFKSYNVQPNKIKLKKTVMPGDINIDKIIPIGLILNELVTNALKHAFTQNEKGLIKVEFLKNKTEFQLAVTDNGVGIPENQTLQEKGFGSRIIKAFAKKLNANVTRTTGSGTSVVISFSNLETN